MRYICIFMVRDMDDIVIKILCDIVKDFGQDVLLNVQKVKALLMDYAPRLVEERKLLVTVLQENIVDQLMEMKDKDQQSADMAIDKCAYQLEVHLFINEKAARFAVRAIATALGISDITTTDNRAEDVAKKDTLEECTFTKSIQTKSRIEIENQLALNDRIDYKAFAAMQELTELKVPETIRKIYPKAFLNCINLKKISLPNTVQEIGYCPFEGCTDLEEISMPETERYKVMNGLLIDKKNRKTIRMVNDCRKIAGEIPVGINCVAKKTFEGKGVKKIFIPRTVSELEQDAFYMTLDLEEFQVDLGNQVFSAPDGVLHSRDGKILFRYPQGKKGINYYLEDNVEKIGEKAFSRVENLQTMTFTSSLKEIGNRAFEYCHELKNIILPGSVNLIGNSAFRDCEKLNSIMISRGVTEIGDYAFRGCASLKSVNIPRNVTRIGDAAFAECTGLEQIIIQDKVAFIGDGVFDGCRNVNVSIKDNPYTEWYCKSRGIDYCII